MAIALASTAVEVLRKQSCIIRGQRGMNFFGLFNLSIISTIAYSVVSAVIHPPRHVLTTTAASLSTRCERGRLGAASAITTTYR